MPRAWPHFAIASVLFCFLPCRVGEAQPKPVRRVLIFNEVGTAYPGINLMDQGIRSALHTSPYKLEVYREYMDTLLFPDPADQQRFRDSYIRKYQNRQPDVIITVGPSPLKFMLETHRSAFPGVPIAFCLPNWGPGTPVLDSDFSGVENAFAPFETIEAALRLQPSTKHIVVVGGAGTHDKLLEEGVRDRLRPYERNFDLSYLTNLTMPDLVETLKRLPNHTVVLFTGMAQDAAGTKFVSGEEAIEKVVAAANAPVFGMNDINLGHGEVGGKVSYIREQGRIAGDIALRMLNGERPQDIRRVRDITAYMFDSRALQRWGFKESDLPPGSIVLNRQPGFWELYREYVFIGISVLLAQTVAIVALLRQRAQRRRTQTALLRSEEKFAKAFHQSPLAFTLASLVDYRFLEVNDTFARYAGWTRDEVLGRTPLQLNLWVDTNQRTTFIEQLRAEGAVRNMELLFRSKGGRVWTGLVSSELIEVSGEPAALSLIADITEAKRAEEARRESEGRFRLVANTAPVMIWMAGLNKLCTYVNQPWLEFTGRSFDQELGNGWAEGIHSEDRENCLKTYFEAFDRRERFEEQYRLRRHDGEYRWIFDIGVPRFEPNGSFAGYIGSCIDVTERKEAEEALSSVGRRLIQAQEVERSRIGRELHDDINQRLALLTVDMDRLDQSGSTNGFHDVLQEFKDRVMEIAKDVQTLSHQLHSSKLEYLGLAVAAKGFCREISEMHNVRIDFTQKGVPRNLPQEVALCVFRVLQEGLQNAVKYSGTDHFEVDLSGTSADIKLRVRDFGRGFSVDDAVGTEGLGLVSMRERVSLVKGEIVIESKSMSGTEITVNVPLPVADPASQVTSGAA